MASKLIDSCPSLEGTAETGDGEGVVSVSLVNSCPGLVDAEGKDDGTTVEGVTTSISSHAFVNCLAPGAARCCRRAKSVGWVEGWEAMAEKQS